jgi:hypothetical protein
MDNPELIIEMALCEVNHVFLKANQLYRFVVMPNCKECAALAAVNGEERLDF